MHPVVLVVITGLSLFLVVALIEDKLMPLPNELLSSTSSSTIGLEIGM
jgi:hypothetical protein